MAAAMSQKEYLKKYLSGPSTDKKKKKKKIFKGTSVNIIDDDIDTSKLRPLDNDELELLALGGEDAPQVAGLVDERPEHVQKLEQFKINSKWRVFAEDDGFNSSIKVMEVNRKTGKFEEEDESDLSPPRITREKDKMNAKDSIKDRKIRKEAKNGDEKQRKSRVDEYSSGKKSIKLKNSNQKNDADSDLSPARSRGAEQQSDSDLSPPRTKSFKRSNSDLSPPRKRSQKQSDSDLSPPKRRPNEISRSSSKRRKSDDDSDLSPVRKKSQKESPVRTKKKTDKSDSDLSPPRKRATFKEKDSDSDLSPPRRNNSNGRDINRKDGDVALPKRSKDAAVKEKKSSRWGDINDKVTVYSSREKDRNMDPVNDRHSRRSRSRDKRSQSRNRRIEKYKSSSPGRNRSRSSPGRSHREDQRNRNRRERSGSPMQGSDTPPRNKKMEKTLDGKKSGLQDARQLAEENREFSNREELMFKNLPEEMSGRNAHVMSRKTGRSMKRENSEDREKQRIENERQKEREEKYNKWGKGLKQAEQREERERYFATEASKPLARYKDDQDLENMLKQQEREGDPMLEYLKEKNHVHKDEMPIYKGSYPPNRFNIRPGYRWDGVDRSNGYENKFFESKSKKIAMDADAYKWSTEDM